MNHDIFKYKGDEYRATFEDTPMTCEGCDLIESAGCQKVFCYSDRRHDNEDVIYKLIQLRHYDDNHTND